MADLGQSATGRLSVLRLHRSPGTITLAIGGRAARADIMALSEQVRAILVDHPADDLVCDVGAVTEPDAVTVDTLAHLQLTVRRFGSRLWLRRVSHELRDLLVLMGLGELMLGPGSGRGALG